MKFEILLSAYNGAKYLPAQMDSLMEQTYGDYHITVRDDGSRDGSGEILESYALAHPDRITLLRDGNNLGYPDCFWYLLDHAEKADLYAFCDQDDLWDKNKLACCAEKCKEYQNAGKPLLYMHDYRISDGELRVYDEYHVASQGFRKDYCWNLMYYVMNSGFALILNEALRRRVLHDPLYGKGLPHDRWMIWCGFFAGDIVEDSRTLVTYRRHEETVTITGKGNMALLREWWNHDIRGTQMEKWEKIALQFADCYGEEMNRRIPGSEKVWRMLAKEKRSPGTYFRRLCFPHRLKPTMVGELVLRLSFLLNK